MAISTSVFTSTVFPGTLDSSCSSFSSAKGNASTAVVLVFGLGQTFSNGLLGGLKRLRLRSPLPCRAFAKPGQLLLGCNCNGCG